MNFKRRLGVAIAGPIAFCTPLAITLAVLDGPSVGTLPAEERITDAERLINAHDCWSREAPADMTDQIPGHVVVTTAAGRTIYSSAQVGPALEQIFDGVDHGLTVHAFCR